MSEITNTYLDHARNDDATPDAQAAATAPIVTDTTTIDAETEPATDPEATNPTAEDDTADDTNGDAADASYSGSEEDGEEDADAPVPATAGESGDAPADVETGVIEPVDAAAPTEPEAVAEPEATDVAEAAAGTAPATRGTTTIGDGVVSTVVRVVASKIEGVHRLDEEDSSVAVDGDTATIRIALVVTFGHPVRALAERIRIDVIDAVEQFLGLDVAAVDIHVSDVHYPETA
ncbi:Asp23/Gls24 family envelope stress response protein [Actinophytocola sediminis]